MQTWFVKRCKRTDGANADGTQPCTVEKVKYQILLMLVVCASVGSEAQKLIKCLLAVLAVRCQTAAARRNSSQLQELLLSYEIKPKSQ